jgi:hypothetical protein
VWNIPSVVSTEHDVMVLVQCTRETACYADYTIVLLSAVSLVIMVLRKVVVLKLPGCKLEV